jgi:hypothetical protein
MRNARLAGVASYSRLNKRRSLILTVNKPRRSINTMADVINKEEATQL